MTAVFYAYAKYYDLLYRDKDYAAEAEFTASKIRERVPDARRVLDLGCGTGAHAECLARLGYSVHGIDLSQAMVRSALERRARLPDEVAGRLSFEQGDVRDIRLRDKYDAVVSLFHVMSYQTSNPDLDAAFATAASHLRAGGVFLFDFWYGPAVLTEKPSVRIKRLEDDEIKILRIAEPVLRSNENIVDVHYSCFVEEKSSGAVSVVTEVHSMRYLFLPELARCGSSDFDQRVCCAWMTGAPLTDHDWSACMSMVRRGG